MIASLMAFLCGVGHLHDLVKHRPTHLLLISMLSFFV